MAITAKREIVGTSARVLMSNSQSAFGLIKPNGSRRRVFTPAVIKLMRRLASQGGSASEIAAVIGSTAASVRVKCCQLQIKLSQRGRPSSMLARGGGEQRLIIYMGQVEYTALNCKAAHMQKSSVELAARLLEAIAKSDLYEAVLDNAE